MSATALASIERFLAASDPLVLTGQHEARALTGQRAPTPQRSNAALIEAYGAHQGGRGFSPKTVKRRTGTMQGFARHVEPGHLGDATTMDIEQWIATKPSPKTRHCYRSDLRQFYAWAVKRGLLDRDPAADTDPIKVPKSLPRPIGPEVHAALLTGPLRTRQIVGLGLFAGLRCAEIAALHTKDMDTHHDPPLLVVRDGKGSKDRVVPMHPVLVDLMAGVPEGFVFQGLNGGHVRSESVSALIRRHFQRCGIEATAHQLRHSFGTEMARAAKGNLVAVASAMGHGSMQTTRQYVGWDGSVAAVVAQMFGGPSSDA